MEREEDSLGTELPTDDGRRLQSARQATQELFESFTHWSDAVGTYGIQTAYAVIAANWAVHGRAQILSNAWAKYSLVVAIAFLATHLVCTGWISMLNLRRLRYANKDLTRWKKEFGQEGVVASAWPYTKLIEGLGTFVRALKVWAPVLSGILFIFSLFLSPDAQQPVSAAQGPSPLKRHVGADSLRPGATIIGVVTQVDTEGNLLTDIPADWITSQGQYLKMTIAGKDYPALFACIGPDAVADGEWAVWDNNTMLRIYLKGGNAARTAGATVGTKVRIVKVGDPL